MYGENRLNIAKVDPIIRFILYHNLFFSFFKYVVTNVKHIIGINAMPAYAILLHINKMLLSFVKLNDMYSENQIQIVKQTIKNILFNSAFGFWVKTKSPQLKARIRHTIGKIVYGFKCILIR